MLGNTKVLKELKIFNLDVNNGDFQSFEEIEIFNQSVSKEDIEAVESLVKGYRETISAFERLSYDVERLKIPIQQQLEVCQKTKIDVALYQNINFGSHLLNMIGIG